MASGIWPSVSGASAQADSVDRVANNLANSETLAFKKDLPTFQQYLANHEREHGALDIPRGPFKDKDFYQLDGRDQAFVVVDSTYTNFKQGALRVTQAPLDVALDGTGFLEVSSPTGIKYTRQGSLHIAPDGRLVTTDGLPVLAANPGGLAAPQTTLANANTPGRTPANTSPADAARFINLRDRGAHFSINSQGEIYSGDELLAKLSVVEFQDTRKLRKSASQTFDNPDPNNVLKEPAKTVVRQGVLETSNVNPIEEMTNLIKANRLFEHDLKAMKTYGEMMQREANDIGKL
ncbi:flagellar hook-basal body protein [Bdellovibrionota bacterium FG-1]